MTQEQFDGANGPAAACLEQTCRVRELDLALKVWGDPAGMPVLALHGWLDNAASFDRLAPLLRDCRVFAVDLPGHGLSGHRPVQGCYNIWDDLPDLAALLETLELPRVALLGHSRGAMIATLLAAALPERVSHLALLDGIIPSPQPAAATARQLQAFVHDHAAPPADRRRRFGSVEEALAARCRASSIDPQAARPIVERNLREAGGAWYWRTDPRLRSASAVKFGEDQIAALLAAVRAPGLLLAASDGHGRHFPATSVLRCYAGLQVETIAGDHHCHLREQAGDIARRLARFFSVTS